MSGLDFTVQELTTILQSATQSSLHSTRRHVFHLLTDVAAVVKVATRAEVCGVQDQLERTFLQLLQHPLKLICTPVQVTLAECYVAMIEWGDSRKTLDAVHSLVKVAVSRADVGNRVAAIFTLGEVMANHGGQLAGEATTVVAMLAKQCKAAEVSVRAAAVVALQRTVEGTADTEGGLRCHATVLKAVEKNCADKAPTVRAAHALVTQALSTASLGHVTVKLAPLLALCAKGLFDPCTPVRSAYAAALATLLANSVLTSQAAVDAAARAAAQSRVHRMRRADVDDTIDIGMGAGGPDDAKIKTSKSSRSRGQADSKAAAKPSADADAAKRAAATTTPGTVPFTLASALRYLASLLSKCEEAATKASMAHVATASDTSGTAASSAGYDDGDGLELPLDHSVSASSFRGTIAIAAAAFLRAVRPSLGDAQLDGVVRCVLGFVAGGSGGSSGALVQRRAVVAHVLALGLWEPAPELVVRSNSQCQVWSRTVLASLCAVFSAVVGSAKDGDSRPQDEFVCDDGVAAEPVSDCGLMCLLEAIGALFPFVADTCESVEVDACVGSVTACLSRASHGVRLAACGCLYQMAVARAGVAAGLLPRLLTELDRAFRHITSAASMAATAASVASSLTGAAGAPARKDKLTQMFALSRTKTADKSSSHPHASASGLGIPGCGAGGGVGVCGVDDAAVLQRMHGLAGAVGALLKAGTTRPEGVGSAVVDMARVLALALVSRSTGKGKAPSATTNKSPAVLAPAAAAAEIDAACVRAGWAVVEGLCCTSPSWAIRNWNAIVPLIHAQLVWQVDQCRTSSFEIAAASHTSATAVPVGDTGYSAITDAWQWTATASATAGLLSLVRSVAPVVSNYADVCVTLSSLLCVAAELLLMPVPGAGMTHVGDKAGDSGTATPPRASAGRAPPGGYQHDTSLPAGPTTPAACGAYVTRRSILQTCACVLESASLLPMSTEQMRAAVVRLLGAAVMVVSGGCVGLHVPTVEALGVPSDTALTTNVTVGLLLPSFATTATATSSTFLLAAALADTAVPELSFDRACVHGADAVLTRGMGESSDPNLPPTLRAVLSSTVLCALDADFAAALHTRMPAAVLDGGDSQPVVPLSLLAQCVRQQSSDHSPLAPLAIQHTADALPGFASSYAASSVLFPTSAVQNPRRLLPAATVLQRPSVVTNRLADAAVVLLAQCVPFLAVDQAEAVVHVMTAPLKPTGGGPQKGRPPVAAGAAAADSASEFLSPIPGLAQALASRVTTKERLQINRNVAGAILMLLSCLKPEHVKGTDKSMFRWVLRCRAALGAGLVSADNIVRRTSAEALGELARLGGTGFAKNLVASIQKQLQDSGGADSKGAAPGAAAKLNAAGQAGAVFALGCVQRANVVTRGRICVENVHDVVIFDAARETKQPLRTWALHTWWLLLDAAGSAFHRYVQPTLALLDAHILSATHSGTYSPSVSSTGDLGNTPLVGRLARGGGVIPPSWAVARSRDADDAFSTLFCDPYPAGRLSAVEASVQLCLARILMALVEGLGPELERKKDWTRRCLAAWTHLCCVPDAGVANVCLGIMRHLVFVAPDMIPRPLLLYLHRSTLLGPSVVHRMAEFVSVARAAEGTDLLSVAAFLCGIRRLGVRFGTDTALPGKGMAGLDALGGGAAFGRCMVYDTIIGAVCTGSVSHCTPLSTLPDDQVTRVTVAVAAVVASLGDPGAAGALAVAAGANRFCGSACPLALLTTGGSRQAALWIQRAVSDYTSVFHHDPALFAASGAWSDLWLAVDEMLALCVSATASSEPPVFRPVYSGASVVPSPQLVHLASWSPDSTRALPCDVETYAACDVGAENSSATPLRVVYVQPAEAAVRALLDMVMSMSSVGPDVVGSASSRSGPIPTFSWLTLCGEVLSGATSSSSDDDAARAPAREEDEGVTMGAGADLDIELPPEEVPTPGAGAGGKRKAKGNAWGSDGGADEEGALGWEAGPGVVPLWRDVRWPTKCVAVALVRLMLHDWRLAFEGGGARSAVGSRPRVPRTVLSQIHDLLNLAGFVATGSEAGDGAMSVQSCGLALLEDILAAFSEEPDPDVPSQMVMQQYQAQVSAVVRSHFHPTATAAVRTRACGLIRRVIVSGIASDRVTVRRLMALLTPDERAAGGLLASLATPDTRGQWPPVHPSMPCAAWCGDGAVRSAWLSVVGDIAVLWAAAMLTSSGHPGSFALRKQGVVAPLSPDAVAVVTDAVRPLLDVFKAQWKDLVLFGAGTDRVPLSLWANAAVASAVSLTPDSLPAVLLAALKWLHAGKFPDDSVARVAVAVCFCLTSPSLEAFLATLPPDVAAATVSLSLSLLLNVYEVLDGPSSAGLSATLAAVATSLSRPLAEAPWLRTVFAGRPEALKLLFEACGVELGDLLATDPGAWPQTGDGKGVGTAAVDRLFRAVELAQALDSVESAGPGLLWVLALTLRALKTACCSEKAGLPLADALSRLVVSVLSALVSVPAGGDTVAAAVGGVVDLLSTAVSEECGVRLFVPLWRAAVHGAVAVASSAPSEPGGSAACLLSLVRDSARDAVLGSLSPPTPRVGNALAALQSLRDLSAAQRGTDAAHTILCAVAAPVFAVIDAGGSLWAMPQAPGGPAAADVVAEALLVSAVLVAAAGGESDGNANAPVVTDVVARLVGTLSTGGAPVSVRTAASQATLALAKAAPAAFKACVSELEPDARQALESAVRAAVTGSAPGSSGGQGGATQGRPGHTATTGRLTLGAVRFRK